LTNFLKPILALVITIIIYTGYFLLADRGLQEFVQTRFYNPSLVNSYINENAADAGIVNDHIIYLQNKFAAILEEPAVRSSFLYNQSAEDIYERSRIFGILAESTGGFQFAQFVDSNGVRIHYSTSSRDIISQNPESASYRNYYEDTNALPFDAVGVPSGGSAKFMMDEKNDRIIFSFPFSDSMDVYRGTALFSVLIRSLGETLTAQGRLKVSDIISVIDQPAGFLLGSPETSRAGIHSRVSAAWSEGLNERVILDAAGSGSFFSLISAKTDNGMFFGRLVNDTLFSVSPAMEWIFRLSMILTLYLTVFFLLNLKPHPLSLVQNRVKRLRDDLFEQLYVKKTGQERTKWILELEQRRSEIRSELKRNLKLRPDQETAVNGIIDKSWDELLAVIKSGTSRVFSADQGIIVKPQIEETGDIEEAEEIDEPGEMEEVVEIEEPSADDDINELEEIGETEETEEDDEPCELEEAGEINESEEELEEVDELEEIEELNDDINETVEYEVENIEIEKDNADKSINNHASVIEFSHPIKTHDDEAEEQTPGKLPDDLEIVSPFSDMFSSLERQNESPEKNAITDENKTRD